MVLIYNSLMILNICVCADLPSIENSSVECLFMFFSHFLIGWFVFPTVEFLRFFLCSGY